MTSFLIWTNKNKWLQCFCVAGLGRRYSLRWIEIPRNEKCGTAILASSRVLGVHSVGYREISIGWECFTWKTYFSCGGTWGDPIANGETSWAALELRFFLDHPPASPSRPTRNGHGDGSRNWIPNLNKHRMADTQKDQKAEWIRMEWKASQFKLFKQTWPGIPGGHHDRWWKLKLGWPQPVLNLRWTQIPLTLMAALCLVQLPSDGSAGQRFLDACAACSGDPGMLRVEHPRNKACRTG